MVVADLGVEEAAVGPEGHVAVGADPLGQCVVVGDDHPALTGRDDLVRVEAEAADVAEAARAPVANGGAVRLGRILDHREPVPLRNRAERVHIDRVPVDVHRHHSAGARRDPALDLVRVHAPGARVAVHEHGDEPRLDHGERAADDREARDDHLAAGLEAQRGDGREECHRAVADRHPVTDTAVRGPGVLEALHVRALGRDPTCGHAIGDVFALQVADQRFVDRDERRAGPGSGHAEIGISGSSRRNVSSS